jgi:hypothetical protein
MSSDFGVNTIEIHLFNLSRAPLGRSTLKGGGLTRTRS